MREDDFTSNEPNETNQINPRKIYFYRQLVAKEDVLPGDIVTSETNGKINCDGLLVHGICFVGTLLEKQSLRLPRNLKTLFCVENFGGKMEKEVDLSRNKLFKNEIVSLALDDFGGKFSKRVDEALFKNYFSHGKQIHTFCLNGYKTNKSDWNILQTRISWAPPQKPPNKLKLVLEMAVLVQIIVNFVLALVHKFSGESVWKVAGLWILELAVYGLFLWKFLSCSLSENLVFCLVNRTLSKKHIFVNNPHIFQKVSQR